MTGIEYVPDSVCDLKRLNTLSLRRTSVDRVPDCVGSDLKRLRYLGADVVTSLTVFPLSALNGRDIEAMYFAYSAVTSQS